MELYDTLSHHTVITIITVITVNIELHLTVHIAMDYGASLILFTQFLQVEAYFCSVLEFEVSS